MAQATLASHTDWHLPQGAASAAAVGGSATSNPAVVSSQPVTAEPPSLIKDFLIRQHLPLGLFVMVVLGFLWPEPGIAVGKTPISSISIFLIFLISGLGLETKAVKTAVKAYASITFGVLSIIVITPLLSFAISPLPLNPPEFSQGLALFCAMPTTISSGVLMTGEAKGNVALALLLSVSTNLLAVFTVPLYAKQIFAEGADGVSIDALDLFLKLALTIFLPLVIGKSLRYFDWVCSQAKRWKLQLKFASSAMLISVPWVMMSQAATKLRSITIATFGLLVLLGIGLHVVLLVFNYAATAFIPKRYMPLSERKAVVINTSQKTVNTAVSVLLALPVGASSGGDAGLMVLPCIISHFAQTIMASFEANWWKRQVDPEEEARARAASTAAGGAAATVDVSPITAATATTTTSPPSAEGDKVSLKRASQDPSAYAAYTSYDDAPLAPVTTTANATTGNGVADGPAVVSVPR